MMSILFRYPCVEYCVLSLRLLGQCPGHLVQYSLSQCPLEFPPPTCSVHLMPNRSAPQSLLAYSAAAWLRVWDTYCISGLKQLKYTGARNGSYSMAPAPINSLRPRQMDAISQTTFSNGFSGMKVFEFRLKAHWSLFPRVQLTKLQHWFW